MPQLPISSGDRRREPRRPAAFAFWFAPHERRPRTSGWMLNISSGGAAFLVGAGKAPPPGKRIALAEMFCGDAAIREQSQPLPPFGRVVRVDDQEDGLTQRVALRFEHPASTTSDSAAPHALAAACAAVISTFPPPPLSRTGAAPCLAQRVCVER